LHGVEDRSPEGDVVLLEALPGQRDLAWLVEAEAHHHQGGADVVADDAASVTARMGGVSMITRSNAFRTWSISVEKREFISSSEGFGGILPRLMKCRFPDEAIGRTTAS